MSSQLDFEQLYQIPTILEDCSKHNCNKSCHARVDLYLYPGELEYLQKHNTSKLTRITPYIAADGSTRAVCHQEGGCNDPVLVCKFAPLLIDTRSGRAEPFHEGFCPVRKFPWQFIQGWVKLICETYINPLLAERERAVQFLQDYFADPNAITPSDADNAMQQMRQIYGLNCEGKETVQLP